MASAIPASAQESFARPDGSTDARSYVQSEQAGTIVQRGGEEIILTQSEFDEVESGAVACGISDVGVTTTNSWWRVFDLSEVPEITDGFQLTAADVGIGGIVYHNDWPNATIELRFYTVDGDVSIENMTAVGDTVSIEAAADIARTVVNVGISGVTIPAGSQLAVELYVPQGFVEDETGEFIEDYGFDIRAGVNPFGETGPTYIYPYGDCGISDLFTVADIGFPDSHWVLTLRGVNATVANEQGAVPAGLALDLYPNPVAGTARLALQLDTQESITVTVYDVTGRQVATLHQGAVAGQLNLELDSSEFTNGVYIVQLRGESFSTTRKFIVLN